MAGPAASLGYSSNKEYLDNDKITNVIAGNENCAVVQMQSHRGDISRYQLLCADGSSNWMNYNITMRDDHGSSTHTSVPVILMANAVFDIIVKFFNS